MTEIELLDLVIGGQKLKDMSAFSFLQWIALKLNNIDRYNPEVNELTLLVQNPPMSRTMSDDQKILLIRKLQKLNVEIK